jgi:hypothetical protein
VTEPPLPVSPDDSDEGWGDEPLDADEVVRRLNDERPPHHDRD